MEKQLSREKPLSNEKPQKIDLKDNNEFEIPRAPVSKRQKKESFKDTGPRSLERVKTMTTEESSIGTKKAHKSIFQMPLKSPNMHIVNNFNQNIMSNPLSNQFPFKGMPNG